jgi:hypothetical protein
LLTPTTANLVQIDKDIDIQGPDSLDVTRYYDAGHHFASEYGYGIGLSFPLTFEKYQKKIWVELRGGSQIPFFLKKNKEQFFGKIDPKNRFYELF